MVEKEEGTSVATSDEEGDVSAESEEGIMSASPSIVFFPSGEDRVRRHADNYYCGSGSESKRL